MPNMTFSSLLIVSHCFSSFLIVYHRYSSFLILSHPFSSFLISHHFSSFLIVSHSLSLFLVISHRFSSFFILSHPFSSFLILSHPFSLFLVIFSETEVYSPQGRVYSRSTRNFRFSFSACLGWYTPNCNEWRVKPRKPKLTVVHLESRSTFFSVSLGNRPNAW